MTPRRMIVRSLVRLPSRCAPGHRSPAATARPARTAARAAAVALGAGVLAVALVPAASATTPGGQGADRPVSFAGVTVEVPASWPVIDVARVPGCVRYDRSAVYLGSPSESTCPAGVIGRTATVQILPAGAQPAAGPVVHADTTGDLTISESGTARVLVTADPADPALAPAIAAGAVVDGTTVGAAAVTDARSAAASSAQAPTAPQHTTAPHQSTDATTQAAPDATTQAVPAPTTFSGLAFDACSAPSLTQLNAWQASRYGALGVYIGGINRGCAQPNLTASWVTTTKGRGWHLLPLYVGLQAPCTTFTNRINPTKAASQGTDAAVDAAAQMSKLGLAAGNPVYLDMESWDNTNKSCTAAVMAFTNSWTAGLHKAGYASGFYSSAGTGIAALVTAVQDKSIQPPDAVWFARWDGKAVTTDPAIPSTMWVNHQRVKQYASPHNETYGGRTINIDSDVVDGPVTPAAFSLSTAPVPTAVLGKPYSVQLYARTGTAPYNFKITTGALPKGLTLSSSGKISGTATTMTAGTSVTITATDKNGATAHRSLTIAVTYTDVATTNKFFGDIAWLTNAGITLGNGDGSFGPTASVLRQSMAAFLYRYAHNGADAGVCSGQSPFTDVLASSIFCGDIAWLKSHGISQGNGDGTFSPTAPVLREQMAAFLYRLTHNGADAGTCTGTPPFTDVLATSIFCGDIAWLKSHGISQGNGDGTFSPTAPVLREQMAAFLHRLSALPAS